VAIGERIRILRKNMGLTQVELARRLKTSQQVITSYERGITTPDADKVPAIAQAMGVTLDELYGDKVPKQTREKSVHGNKRTAKAMELFDRLSPGDQRTVLKLIRNLLAQKD
jgi:transcriptional regulator with XRE-family HTH domain